MTPKHPETLVLHAGYRAEPATGAVAVPIDQTTSHQFWNAGHVANLGDARSLASIPPRPRIHSLHR